MCLLESGLCFKFFATATTEILSENFFNILSVVLVMLCAYIAWKPVSEKGDVEGYRRYSRIGKYGGLLGGWGYWGHRYAWPYYAGLYTNWPPYLYGLRRPYYRGERCVESNEASDCDPFYPRKVGTDTDDDGVKDSWKCCRRY